MGVDGMGAGGTGTGTGSPSGGPRPPAACTSCGTPIHLCVACVVKAFAQDVAKEYGPIVGQMILGKVQTYLAKQQHLPAPPAH
jgi:hypothetical protein